jgi:hypothetical protein
MLLGTSTKLSTPPRLSASVKIAVLWQKSSAAAEPALDPEGEHAPAHAVTVLLLSNTAGGDASLGRGS